MNIKYVIVKNDMPASSTEAKYLGMAIPNGVRNRAQLTAEALKSEHFAEATFAAVLDAAVAVTQVLCAAGSDVDWGPMKFLAKMHGSLPCEDSEFADGTASLTVDADATNATRGILEGLTPVKISAAKLEQYTKVSNVMDVTTEAFGTVIGTTEFAILGNGITLDGEGEYAKALDKKTLEVKGTATVLRVSKGQRAYCKFNPQLADGDYTLEVATKGLIGETTPRIFRKPVTAIAVEVPPTPEPIAQTSDGLVKVMTFTDGGQSETFTYGNEWLATGSGFRTEASLTDWWTSSVELKLHPDATETYDLIPEVTDEGTKLHLTTPPEGPTVTPGTYPYAMVRVHQSRGENQETLALQAKVVVG